MKFDVRKATQVMNLLLTLKWSYLDKLSVLKLIWLADRYHLRTFWKPILNDIYFAMEMWPVASGVKYIFDLDTDALTTDEINYIKTYLKKFSFKIISNKAVDYSMLSESNVEVIKMIYSNFWNNNSSKLVDITHKYPEWKKFEDDIKRWRISKMDYIDFFENTPNQDRIFDISEEDLEITKEIFQENLEFEKLFA